MNTKPMTAVQIKEILRLHSLWLLREPTGKKANLQGANLEGANLSWANLEGANLFRANLSWANLRGTNLRGTNLRGASLEVANLFRANLEGANLEGANLTKANLRGANLHGAKLPDFQICPKEGKQFIGWKKVQGNVILKLLILKASKRTNSLRGRKCRASKVKVLEAFGAKPGQKEFKSNYDSYFTYRIGKHAEAANFDGDIRFECTSGIHFFMTRKEAEEYTC